MKVGLVGTGVIGAGWAVRALSRGHQVVAGDAAPGAEERLRERIERAWPPARKLGLFPDADPSALTWVATVEEVGEAADFIQESVPENMEVKAGVHAAVSATAGDEVIIASSSSGLLPSEMQLKVRNPERFVVGHPFNPVYLLPLVEVVAGDMTCSENVERARDFYAGLGMHPLVVRNEIEGYLSDRLQEAMWREILHLVNDGVATTDELDQAIIYGPGLRWAAMGVNLTFHLAGGRGGMRHMLGQFGPTLGLPWSKLEAPRLTEELIEAMASGTEDQAGDLTVDELERIRDDCLIAVMRGLRAEGVGAGKVIAEREAAIRDQQAARWSPGLEVPTPLRLYRAPVEPDWVDYNDHMTESAYLLAAGWASDKLFRYIGIDEAYRNRGMSVYTVETHICFKRETSLDQTIVCDTYLLGVDDKRIHLVHVIRDAETEDALASVEQMLVHVDTSVGKSTPIPTEVRTALDSIMTAHIGADTGVRTVMRAE